MSLKQRIQEEIKRVASNVDQLKKEDTIDRESLKGLQEEYKKAVFNDGDIDSLNEEIKTIKSRIEKRKIKLEAFTERNNPIIQDMVIVEVDQWLKEIAILEEQAEVISGNLQPIYQKLSDGLEELVCMKYRVDNLREAINYFNKLYLNDASKRQLNLNAVGYDGNPVLNKILPLLIEHKDVFKVR
ncbi:putative RNase H-like nuclease (RuvC/YqgF family) [Cytobacillus horneckiae]|uniref:hypothetical protein n=1 Tax=Cytobacillus horneckiae TaxID=549687 RepID=UPI0019D25D7B|nr:hypothetical protein [Cytobacillus horneckiae]MBN6890038.1 hypothetical protein [Cytobacillus horneckiae]